MTEIAMTGATGFVGRATLATLVQAGHRVQALARSPEAAGTIRAAGGIPVSGDLFNTDRLAELVRKADAVVHCAGQVRGSCYQDFQATNVDGSAHLFEAAAQVGAPVLAISSLAAREPGLSEYGRSKADMEARLQKTQGAAAAILRPPVVYGPGDRELTPLFELLNKGLALVPGSRRARFSVVHVQDLAAAIAAWVAADQRVTGTYEIHDGHAGGYSWHDLISMAESLRGGPIRRLPLPATAWKAAAMTNSTLARLLDQAPMLTPDKLAQLQHEDWVADNSALEAVLAWQPTITLSQGLATAYHWAGNATDKERKHERSLSANLFSIEGVARTLRAVTGRDRAADSTGGRPGAGFGTGDGNSHGAGGPAGHRHADELPAGGGDHGRSGQSHGREHRQLSLFDKFDELTRVREDISAAGVDPLGVPIERIISATEGVIDNRRVILAGTNNYLGLTFDQACVEASVDAVRAQGTGTTGSRMANGSYSGHLALERELASFYDVNSAIVFSTGYQANLAMLSTLVGTKDTVMLDADCHASIYDGVKLGGARTLLFKHNDPLDLDKRLNRLGDQARHVLIVVEGIYSMLGDVAPLADIVAVAEKHGAAILVDEAHSMGIMGAHGRGVVESEGVLDRVDFIIGTFSKSLGAVGGFCVSRHAELERIRYTSRPYIFTASPAPAVIASVRMALKRLRTDDGLRESLWRNARHLHRGLEEAGFTLASPPGPVVAAVFKSRDVALQFWQQLLDRGVYVNLMLPPATPSGKSLIRASLSAAHSPEQIDRIVAAFTEIGAP